MTNEQKEALDTADKLTTQIALLELYAGAIIEDYSGDWITREEAEERLTALNE